MVRLIKVIAFKVAYLTYWPKVLCCLHTKAEKVFMEHVILSMKERDTSVIRETRRDGIYFLRLRFVYVDGVSSSVSNIEDVLENIKASNIVI